MKLFYTTLTLLILVTTSAFSQKKAMKDFFANAKEIQQRPLKIILLKEGKEKNDIFNKNIKAAIQSEWYISENFNFISQEEYKVLKKEKSSEFAFLMYLPPKTTSTNRKITIYEDGLIYFGYNEKGKKVDIMGVDICFEKSCSQADYYHTVQDIQNRIYALSKATEASTKKMKMKDVRALMEKAQKEQQENIKRLENMTLYVNEKSLNDKLKKDFGKYYKYDFKITTIEEIESAVLDNNDSIALLRESSIVSANTGMVIIFFVDTSKMKGLKVKTKTQESIKFFDELFSYEIQKKDLERLKDVLN